MRVITAHTRNLNRCDFSSSPLLSVIYKRRFVKEEDVLFFMKIGSIGYFLSLVFIVSPVLLPPISSLILSSFPFSLHSFCFHPPQVRCKPRKILDYFGNPTASFPVQFLSQDNQERLKNSASFTIWKKRDPRRRISSRVIVEEERDQERSLNKLLSIRSTEKLPLRAIHFIEH